VPAALPYHDGSFGEKDFVTNPALMGLENDVLFLLSSYYLGSTTNVDLDSVYTLFWAGPPFTGTSSIDRDEKYQVNNWVNDAGFALSLSEMASLGFFVRYRYGDMDMEGDFTNNMFWPAVVTSNLSSRYDRNVDTDDISLALLLDLDISDAFSMGLGFKYEYVMNESDYNLSASGTSTVFPPTERSTMDVSFDTDYHRFAPVLGVSLAPAEGLALDAFVEMGFIVGGVEETATLFSNPPTMAPGSQTHTHSIDSRDLDGWDIASRIDVTYALNETVSMPFFIDFSYGAMDWNLDGSGTGAFGPILLLALPAAPGTIDHDSDYATWSLSGGVGVDMSLDAFDLGFMLAYTHWEYSNDYWYQSICTRTVGGLFTAGNSATFEESVSEKRNVISLDVTLEKEFSEAFAAAFGMRYDLGWGVMDLDRSVRSGFHYNPPVPTLVTSVDDRDLFHNLTLSADVSFMPVDRLTLSMGGMVRIPLNGLDYDLAGESSGTYNFTSAYGPTGRWQYNGATTLGYDTTTWEYGGMLELTYEF
jgi:hypothetical protein